MKYLINLDNHIFDSKVNILDKNNNVAYFSQYDFSYKNRVHIYDNLDNEIGYVQYIIFKNQKDNLIYDKFDSLMEFNNWKIINESNKKNVYVNEEIVMNIEDNKQIEILNEDLKDKCILFAYSLIGKGEQKND